MGFYNFIFTLLRFLSKILYRVEITGQENIPDNKNVIIVANHKSFLDPIFMMIAVRNRRIIPVAKKELFDVPVLKHILKKLEVIPIDRANPGLTTIREILKQIKNGRILGIFPEGTRSTMDKFLPAKPGVGLFATKTKSEIIPISIITKYRVFSKVKIIIGKPIDMTKYYEKKISKEEYAEMAQLMMNVVEDNYEKNKKGIL